MRDHHRRRLRLSRPGAPSHDFARDGHAVAILTRRPRPGVPDDIALDTRTARRASGRARLDGADAVVNLAGEGIADNAGATREKRRSKASRLLATRSLSAAIARLAAPPASSSVVPAVGYYGARGDEVVTEGSPPGSDFLADLCVEWEREAEQASARTRVVLLRTGLVLHPDGGALGKMLLPFRLGARWAARVRRSVHAVDSSR